jgi:hypothetical protein
MTLTPQTSEISDNLSLDELSEAELLSHFGIHAVMSRTPRAAELNFEYLCSQTQPAGGEPPSEEDRLKEVSPDVSCPAIDMATMTTDQSSQPLAKECPKNATATGGDGACEPKSSAESEQKNETEV